MDRASITVLTLALVTVGLAVTGELTHASTPIEHRVVDRDVPLAGVHRLVVRSSAVDIHVTAPASGPGAPGPARAHVHLDLKGTQLADVAVDVARDGDAATITLESRARTSGWSMMSGTADIALRAPVDLSVSSASGDVAVANPPRATSASTASGDVKITGAGHDVRANTASGDVTLALTPGFAGDTVSAATASGAVVLDVASGFRGTLRTHTLSGSVVDDAHFAPAARPVVSLETASGDIHVGMP